MKHFFQSMLIILGVGIFGYFMMIRNNVTFVASPSPVSTNATSSPSSVLPTTPVAQPVSSPQTPAPKPTPTPVPKPAPQPAGTFTLAQVATHNTESNCYSVVNGVVYNLTAWIAKHPGGDRSILKMYGKDGSAAFNGQHGGESKPEKILAGYEVGTLI